METFKTSESVTQDKDSRKDIRGDVILGVRDPRKMTEKEFITSPEALFHGYNRGYFKYSPEYDYDSDEYFENTEGSATLGQGLYVTDSFAEAAKYSHTRTSKSKLEMPAGFDPSVEIFLPYKAKMLDLRLNSDPNKNGHVPVQFAEFWKKYYDSFYNRIKEIIASENIKNGKEIIPDSIYSTYKNYNKYGTFEQYRDLIEEVIDSDMLDLRYLLGTASNENFKNNLGVIHSPPWVTIFGSFVKKLGYDGLIYIEAGDAYHYESVPSFVFYNLDKIGNYRSWKSGEHKVE